MQMESESDLRGRKQTYDMGEANEAKGRSELEAAQRLQDIAIQLIDARGIEALYDQILDTVLAILNSDFASLQMFFAERGIAGELRLLGHRGFTAEAARRWEWVQPTTRTTCGEALRTRQRVAIEDIRNCDFMAGSEDLDGYLDAGIRAGQTTPLVSRSGALLGMVSTYWRDPHELSLSEVRVLDVLARLTADLIESSRGEEALRRSEERFGRVMNNMAEGLYTTDKKGLVNFVNPAAEKMFGWASAELLGKKMHDIIHYKHIDGSPFPASECPRLRVLKTGIEFHENEDFFIRKDGTFFPVVSSSSPIMDGDETAGMVVVFRDDTERRRAETALRESEERFRNMADTAPVMIWVTGADKGCTFVNKSWLDFTGHTLKQDLGDGWTSSVHPEDVDRCIATYYSSFDARLSFQMEYRVRRADGEYRWVLDSGRPVWSEGEFGGFVGSCVDISEQKMVEERLRASEARLLDAQRLAKVGSWERQVETDEIRWSDEMFRIFGLVNEPPSLAGLLKYVHARDREKLLEADRQVRSGSSPVEVEYRMIRPDGELRFLRTGLQAIRNDQGVPVRIVGTTQDITELVKTRESLREGEDRLKQAERIAHLGHWQWDIRTNRLSGSEEMFRIFGKASDYVPSYEGFLEDLLPSDREKLEQLIGDSLTRKVGHSMEYCVTHPNGDLRTISCIWEVLLDEEGLPAQVFGTCQDITDAKQAQTRDFERQKLETVGTLAGGIAHDFNNLLAGVLSQAELALAEVDDGSYPVEQLGGIQALAIRGSDIVRELMIYGGQESAVAGPVDVSRVVEEMLGLLKISVSKHAKLITDLGGDLPAVWGNATQLGQIVMNLVTNASEAIGARDGVIHVTTKRVTVGGDSFEATQERLVQGDYVQLELSDTGPGMSLETQAKVFDPFFTTKSAGHGLGLAVVHGIVRSLGGSISIESELGMGTSFRILLPCSETQVGRTDDERSGAEAVRGLFRAATILVVEDETPLRRAVVKMLHRAGLSVIEAIDGFAALEAIRAPKRIDVLLLDITIPGAPSREVFEEAKRLRPNVSLIVTSAYGEDVAAETLGRGGHFIRKPYRIDDLLELIRQTIS